MSDDILLLDERLMRPLPHLYLVCYTLLQALNVCLLAEWIVVFSYAEKQQTQLTGHSKSSEISGFLANIAD